MRQTAALMPIFQTRFDKYPATWFPTAFTRDTEWPHLIITNSSAYANGVSISREGDFVIRNVGSVVQDIRRAFGNALGETMPKISVMKMVK